uniref:Uncharacterized protein n=1 Tax=Opuntia streptacantha TaxID=393608 RepID=A0A7C9F1U1_OPUST
MLLLTASVLLLLEREVEFENLSLSGIGVSSEVLLSVCFLLIRGQCNIVFKRLVALCKVPDFLMTKVLLSPLPDSNWLASLKDRKWAALPLSKPEFSKRSMPVVRSISLSSTLKDAPGLLHILCIFT